MADFRSLGHGAQLLHLDALARTVAAQFEVRSEQIELLQYERNAVYRLTDAAGARYVLRIGAEDGRSTAEQRSEMTLLRWLRSHGHRVPEPLLTPGGDGVLEVASGPSAPRVCVVLRWLEGELPSPETTERQVAELGAATARLHRAGPGLSTTDGFERPTLGATSALADSALPDPYRGLLQRLGSRLRAELGELEREPLALLHGDLHRDNVLLRGESAAFIDFEDCGWGHPLFDVASLLDSFRRRVVERGEYPRARAAFLEAYGPAPGSPRELTEQLSAFKAMRDAITLRFIAASRNPSVQSWATPRLAQLVRHIDGYLQGEPARI